MVFLWILLGIWAFGSIFNVFLWSLIMCDKHEVTLGDIVLGLGFLVFSWTGWCLFAMFDFAESLEEIIIYRKK